MTCKDISLARSPLLKGSMAAMERAAAMAREIAIQTNTAIILVKDGKVKRVTADELRREDAERKLAEQRTAP